MERTVPFVNFAEVVPDRSSEGFANLLAQAENRVLTGKLTDKEKILYPILFAYAGWNRICPKVDSKYLEEHKNLSEVVSGCTTWASWGGEISNLFISVYSVTTKIPLFFNPSLFECRNKVVVEKLVNKLPRTFIKKDQNLLWFVGGLLRYVGLHNEKYNTDPFDGKTSAALLINAFTWGHYSFGINWNKLYDGFKKGRTFSSRMGLTELIDLPTLTPYILSCPYPPPPPPPQSSSSSSKKEKRVKSGKLPKIKKPNEEEEAYFTNSAPRRYLTDKAEAMRYLKSSKFFFTAPYKVWPATRVPDSFPVFARPCPKFPRHGFVDSGIVYSQESLDSLIATTLKADPFGEVLFMSFIPPEYSGVLTKSSISLGEGNDGVTGGKKSYIIPCENPIFGSNGVLSDTLPLWIKPGKNEELFFEFVARAKTDRTYLVQIRKGPKFSGESNFVPKKIEVTKWLIPEENQDLLAWEKICAENAGISGLAIHIPGSSLASHAAVHGIINSIPVWTGEDQPSTLLPTKSPKLEMSLKSRKALAQYIKGVLDVKLEVNAAYVGLAISAFHAQVNWGEEDHLLKLRAWALVALVRSLATACGGELRHWHRQGPGRRGAKFPKNYAQVFSSQISNPGRSSRETIYKATKNLDWGKLTSLFDSCEEGFGGGWSSGYGGKKWLDGAKRGKELCRLLNVFLSSPKAKNYIALLKYWNFAMDAAHNGGKLLDKWLGSDLGKYADAQYHGILNKTVWDIVSGKVRTPKRKAW